MVHPKLIVYSDDRTIDYTIDWQYINHGIIKNISQLNKGINASSSTAEVTLSHDSPYTLPILECEKDLHAILYETVSGTNVPHFTGYVSQDFTWTVDSHGVKAVKLTLEDVGTKLLKKPYTTTVSEKIKGTASACIATICSRVGITATSSILNINTPVETIAENGETCQELLTALCRELGYSYYFNVNGELELKKLSTDNLSGVTTVDDTDLYDTIKLNKQARQYKGSRITYKALKDRADALIYRDITNQSSSHKDCWVELSANEYYPTGADANNDVKVECVDLNEGKEIYSIDASTLTPTVTWTRGTGTSSITLSGANTLAVKLQCTSTGSFNKAVVSTLQATADITYVDSTEIIYGNGEVGAEDYYECDCRWLHTKTPAEEFANFVAQYYQFCSREFTFKSKAVLQLGQIIKLHENLFSGLETYLIINTIKETDSTQIISYTASSISAFNYSKQTSHAGVINPPSTVYVEIPDIEGITMEIVATPNIFYTDLRDSTSGQIDFKYLYNGTGTVPAQVIFNAETDTGTPIAVTPDSSFEGHISVSHKSTAKWIKISGYVTGYQSTTYTETTVNIIDNTVWNKNWGTITTLPADSQVLNGDYFLAGSGLTGYTYGVPYVRVAGSWTQLTGNSVENVQRLLNTLGNALNSDLTVPAVSALYAWFGTLIAQDAVITNLFSKNITILQNGSIHSAAYTDAGIYVGPGSGFWIGANGQLLCHSAEAVNMNVSGNSSFHGSFDCDVIKTEQLNPTATVVSNSETNNYAKRMAELMAAVNISSGVLTEATVSGYSNIAYIAWNQSSSTFYTIKFYDSSRQEIQNVNSIPPQTKVGSGNIVPYLYSNTQFGWGTYFTNRNTVTIYVGGNKLWVDIPSGPSGLTAGMIYAGTTASGGGYPLYVKA